MHLRPQIVVLTVFVLAASLIDQTAGLAGDCTFLNKDPMKLRDGELLYLAPGGTEWDEVKPSSKAISGQTVDFAYVIQEKINQSRAGVAIVKSGRLRQQNENDLVDQHVDLVRNTQDSDPEICKPVPPSMSASVSSRSYDDYHDRGLGVADQATLNTFHYEYADRYGSCKKTNLVRPDARSRRTNLGQFSFDADVVDGKNWNRWAGSR